MSGIPPLSPSGKEFGKPIEASVAIDFREASYPKSRELGTPTTIAFKESAVVFSNAFASTRAAIFSKWMFRNEEPDIDAFLERLQKDLCVGVSIHTPIRKLLPAFKEYLSERGLDTSEEGLLLLLAEKFSQSLTR